MPTRLTKATKALIRKDNQLSFDIAKALNIQLNSIGPAMFNNSLGLISYPILKIISDHTGEPIENLVEEIAEKENEPTADAVGLTK